MNVSVKSCTNQVQPRTNQRKNGSQINLFQKIEKIENCIRNELKFNLKKVFASSVKYKQISAKTD